MRRVKYVEFFEGRISNIRTEYFRVSAAHEIIVMALPFGHVYFREITCIGQRSKIKKKSFQVLVCWLKSVLFFKMSKKKVFNRYTNLSHFSFYLPNATRAYWSKTCYNVKAPHKYFHAVCIGTHYHARFKEISLQ